MQKKVDILCRYVVRKMEQANGDSSKSEKLCFVKWKDKSLPFNNE